MKPHFSRSWLTLGPNAKADFLKKVMELVSTLLTCFLPDPAETYTFLTLNTRGTSENQAICLGNKICI